MRSLLKWLTIIFIALPIYIVMIPISLIMWLLIRAWKQAVKIEQIIEGFERAKKQ